MVSLLAAISFLQGTSPVTITVHADKSLHPVSKDLYGIFFEEINCAGDGGIYPELIRNRSFEDSDKAEHWDVPGFVNPKVANGKLSIDASDSGDIINNGYWGMHLEKGQPYTLQITGDFPANYKMLVHVADYDDPQFSTEIEFKAGSGQTKTITIVPNKTITKGSLIIPITKGDKFALDYVSLFPVKTFKDRKNGLRPGLMNMLTNMKPAFVRFPGGCWVEGDRMASAYRWKTTINNLETRRTVPNLWGYKSTNGLGYHEYLQMCEDLGSAPLFVVNCGMSHQETIPLNQMDEYVQDALDAIEYANGPVSSKWGAVRAANGHPKSFNLKYMEIGNENGGPAYSERYKLIFDAVKKKYPEITTIADVWGGTPSSAQIETIDEHYYSDPGFFFRNANRYDTYDRKGPKVYVGEYAVTQGAGSGNHIAAIAEAAFMTGMERNSDHVVMASYAPLFANVNLKSWNPDLIYFDSSKVYGTPSYYVQKLFAQNRPSEIVQSSMSALPASITPFPSGGIGVGTWATKAEFKDITLTENGVTKTFGDPKSELKPTLGTWEYDGNLLRQTSMEDGARSVFASATSKNYTLKLKAKKISGNEGFLITVGYKDQDNYLWLNLGGWGNSQHGLENAVSDGKSEVGRRIPGRIETGRWYDVQIDYSPDRVICKLDGKAIFDQRPASTPRFFYTSGIDKSKNELVVKVVQGQSSTQDVVIKVEGVQTETSANVIELSNANPQAENSLEKPTRVSPVSSKTKIVNGNLSFRSKPYSLTIFRIPLQKKPLR